MNDIAQIPPQRSSSLITKVATRFGVDPTKMMDTLKATAFKVKDATVTNEQMMALLIVADQYGLNPFTKEIYAFPDKGGIVPVVGIDGWARIINEHPSFDGMDFTMPDDGSSCTCQIYRKDRGHSISVTEYMAECKRGTQPWSSHPRRMLRHKAMIQCARMAFGFAGIYDRDEADRIAKGATIDSDSGEIIDMPSTTGIAAVRRVASKSAKPTAASQADAQTGETTPPNVETNAEADAKVAVVADAATMSRLQAGIFKASDAETAALVLDEARGLVGPDQHETLASIYKAKWGAS